MRNLTVQRCQMSFESMSVTNVCILKILQMAMSLCLYVDDMLIIDSNNDIIKATKRMLTSKFNMKDLGVADVILGIKISRKSNGLVLSQSHYIKKVLEKFK